MIKPKKSMKKFLISITTISVFTIMAGLDVYAAGGGKVLSDPNAFKGLHFHPEGKMPSDATKKIQEMFRKSLPFDDKRDFEEAKRGFIAAPEYKQIMADAGHVAWDMASYEWLLQDKQFDSIHPSLQRQAVLNMGYGLYEVLPGKIYQIRGYDLANISFLRGKTGWIVIHPLTSQETAREAIEFINEQIAARPVTAVIYSHSHADHFGGVRGVADEADVKAGKVQIIAPLAFMDHAVSENVYAGTAMNRRMFYQYGVLLPRSPFGHVDQSIGKAVSAGNLGLIAPTMIIKDDYETHLVDGVKMVFQNTPGTEAPSEMNTYLPEWKAFWAAENITGTIHNIYTLRGAQVRDALAWSKGINEALYRFGTEAEVMFASHSWPRWGNDRVQEVMRAQRDAYAHLNNGVLHLANQGITINEIHNEYKVPNSLENQWSARSYHGSVKHNSRAVINRYLGYWDANPATLIPLSPEDSAPLYVEMMGGSAPIMQKAKSLHDAGNYLLAQEILNKLIYAEPQNTAAKKLLADVYEQLGYQQESPSVRNSFLAGAYELRSGLPPGDAPSSTGPDMIKAMSTELWLDYLGIMMDSDKADGKSYVMNLVVPDVEEQYVVELSNGTLTNIKGFQADNPDLTVAINRSDLEKTMMGAVRLVTQIEDGTAIAEGNPGIINELASMMVNFSLGFEILPGTVSDPEMQDKTPFEQDDFADTSGG
jgi:alkyl sulfatase BDS1-like metallo-beta-lactamase superfamily hydrolase